MRSAAVLFLLALVARAHGKDAIDSRLGLVDRLIGNFVDELMDHVPRIRPTDLDHLTLGSPVNFAVSGVSLVRPIVAKNANFGFVSHNSRAPVVALATGSTSKPTRPTGSVKDLLKGKKSATRPTTSAKDLIAGKKKPATRPASTNTSSRPISADVSASTVPSSASTPSSASASTASVPASASARPSTSKADSLLSDASTRPSAEDDLIAGVPPRKSATDTLASGKIASRPSADLGLNFEKPVETITRPDVEALESVALVSDVGMDYSPLKKHLEKGEFQKADDETRALLIKLAGPEAELRNWVYFSEVKFIPATDLLTIDKLWSAASKGKYGYSVQKEVWEKSGQQWEVFFKAIGWKTSDVSYKTWPEGFTYSLEAPKGHLPLTNALRGYQLFNSIFQHPAFKDVRAFR